MQSEPVETSANIPNIMSPPPYVCRQCPPYTTLASYNIVSHHYIIPREMSRDLICWCWELPCMNKQLILSSQQTFDGFCIHFFGLIPILTTNCNDILKMNTLLLISFTICTDDYKKELQN